ncbi:hypothetical protein Q669_29540 [Labrenzia sp. C1B10]|uniref:hypothetical protein n=1 Tax=unclassified Labrenzia TaxID=2648686 RepID=UPI0003B8CF69|nr:MULTISPECIES: hypothetical protein [unclassified Labrenzia]ERP95714.1 hypothetical protein Q669_29540 [Labrenzia sp. C1B10]ERS05780.1 hypothetical protein Q675_29105 [Labrenzia sp. C1B70]
MSGLLDELERRIKRGELTGFTVWPTSGDSKKAGRFMVSVKKPGRESYGVNFADTIEDGLALCLAPRDRDTGKQQQRRSSRRNDDDLI